MYEGKGTSQRLTCIGIKPALFIKYLSCHNWSFPLFELSLSPIADTLWKQLSNIKAWQNEQRFTCGGENGLPTGKLLGFGAKTMNRSKYTLLEGFNL